MSNSSPSLLASIRGIADKLSVAWRVPAAAHVSVEDLVVIYTIGEGTIIRDQSQQKTYLKARGEIYRTDGTRDGSWEGVHEIVVPLAELWNRPPPPPPPFNRSEPPVPEPPAQAYTKGTWTFGDGSSLTAVGQAILHAAELQNEATNLFIAANEIVSSGVGRYDGAHGLKTSAISLFFPPGVPLDGETNVTLKSLEVFRVTRKEFIGQPPAPPS
jgi:hypothetical protein